LLKKGRKRLKRSKSSVSRKNELSRQEKKHQVGLIKSLISSSDERLNDYKQLLFLWRYFGDAIVGIYHSTYSLKHLFYDGDYNPKPNAGFITGKESFRQEYKSLIFAIRKGIPTVLCDLTNIVRHGDLCLMGAEEPFLIEMKSSKNTNARTDRQAEQLNMLGNFFANDGGENFRSAGPTKRVALSSSEVNYYSEVNQCLSTALNDGTCLTQPEKGLSYFSYTSQFIANHSGGLKGILDRVVNETTMIVIVSPTESSLPLQSCALSFSPENTCQFIQEELHLVVLIDINEVKEQIKQHGYHALAIMDGVFSFQLMVDQDDLLQGGCRISEQMFLRIACEFQSLSWFATESAHSLKNLLELSEVIEPSEENYTLNDEQFEEWGKTKDCFD
jgi:hypothetical protein